MNPAEKSGEPCWIELFTPDTDAAAAFYGPCSAGPPARPAAEFGGYRMFLRGRRARRRADGNDGTSGPNTWSVYLQHRRHRQPRSRRPAPRGAVLAPGRCRSPTSARWPSWSTRPARPVGAWQPDDLPRLRVTRAEVGAPGGSRRSARTTRRRSRSTPTCSAGTPHTMSDTADFRYTTLGKDQDARAGIMDATAFLGDQPSRWQFYLQVADTDATVGRRSPPAAQLAAAGRGHAVRPARGAPGPGGRAVQRHGPEHEAGLTSRPGSAGEQRPRARALELGREARTASPRRRCARRAGRRAAGRRRRCPPARLPRGCRRRSTARRTRSRASPAARRGRCRCRRGRPPAAAGGRWSG